MTATLSPADRQLADGFAQAFPLAANETLPLRAYIVQIKRRNVPRLTFEAMGRDSASVVGQHIGLLEDGEYISVRPASARESIDALKKAWMQIGKAFQDGDDHCNDCAHHEVTRQRVGFDDGAGVEVIGDCTLGRRGEKPSECPAYAARVREGGMW